jgi:predicted membrane channel-forming protein YqfA (hemolysin III family)
MHRIGKQSILFFLVLTLILVPFQVAAEDSPALEPPPTDPGAMVADLLLARPLGIVAMALGAVFFVVSIPFSASGGNTNEAFHRMVGDPAAHTFGRPLGKE